MAFAIRDVVALQLFRPLKTDAVREIVTGNFESQFQGDRIETGICRSSETLIARIRSPEDRTPHYPQDSQRAKLADALSQASFVLPSRLRFDR
jgi:hypothetical protein